MDRSRRAWISWFARLLFWLAVGSTFTIVNGNTAAAPATPPACTAATAALTPDYAYVVGSAAFSDPDGDPEASSSFRWLADGAAAAAGPVAEELLLHFDDSTVGANGETPLAATGVSYTAGRFGQALALDNPGSLTFARPDNLPLAEGTWEFWTALRADGSDPAYGSANPENVLLYYQAPNGDDLFIAQNANTGVLYAGSRVNGVWQSANSDRATTRAWRAGEWHHVACTFSAAGNFIRLYLDGVLVADTTQGHYTPPAADGDSFAVGGRLGGAAAHYWLDEVRLSARAADRAEIAARAQRTEPPAANEIWLPTAGLAPGVALVYEFTPAAGGESAAPCSSAPLTYPGIPITDPQPLSTLLPPGSTSLDLAVDTVVATACAWAVGAPRPFDQMTPFDADLQPLALAPNAVRSTHTTRVTGLDPAPNTVNVVTVRCAVDPDYLLTLHYRSLADAHPAYPRTGNVWGWWQFVQKGLAHMAPIDLWLSNPGPIGPPIAALRALNPDVRVLTASDAVANNDLARPGCAGCTSATCDAWYLKDVSGAPIENWPGKYVLNLTKPEVAEYQGCYAHQTWVESGYQADGVFFDNVVTNISWLAEDCYGNPVVIDADENGVADVPAVLDAAWKAGMLHEIETFRQFLPNAIAAGHSLRIDEPGILELFNGVSIGFQAADVLEGERAFSDVFATYRDWLRLARAPAATMLESSPLDDIAYGYDYSPLSKIPAATLEFARTYTPWMRFGLALTLLADGYFTHEFGDTWHGSDWWYDELDFDLGQPLGEAARVPVAGFDYDANQIVNPGFEQPIVSPWRFWYNTSQGCAATLSRDTAAPAPEGSAAARIDVTATCGAASRIELAQADRSLTQGVRYDATFWARSDVTRTIGLSSMKGSANWDWYGLTKTVTIGPAWQEYTVSFAANATVSDARLQFWLGGSTGTVWLDDVHLALHPPDLYRRDFDNGIVLLNGTDAEQAVDLNTTFWRLFGRQAPRYETILDDAGPSFAVVSGAWTAASYDSGEWTATGPFYHDWASGLRVLSSETGEARWSLPISATGVYTVAAWWPAAPAAAGWNAAARFEIVADGVTLAATTFDQRTGGDQWHALGAVMLAPADDAYVRLICTGAAAAPCVADALHLFSAARYNDGSPAESVTLAPLDGIVLARAPVTDPTAVTVSGIDAEQVGDAIVVAWETSSEVHNLGFNLWRGAAPTGPDSKLNEALIPSHAPGSPVGAAYTWEDRRDLVTGTVYYWLEDLDARGTLTRHPAVSVDYHAPTAVGLAAFNVVANASPARVAAIGFILAGLVGLVARACRR